MSNTSERYAASARRVLGGVLLRGREEAAADTRQKKKSVTRASVARVEEMLES
jgi:hypothetical protein